MSTRFTDFAFAADGEGIYDLVIDEDARDFATSDGLESAFFVALFSDRRARPDEVADPMKRRGWTGDTIAADAGDRHGSGLWLYEQRRLTQQVAAALRFEAEASLAWMTTERLMRSIAAEVLIDPATRTVRLLIDSALPQGGTSTKAYTLALNTQTGLLARI